MIARLNGKVLEKSPEGVVLDVNGVGYELSVPLSTYYAVPEPGETTLLHVHTHLREDALKLFGFFTPEEKTIFETLIGISKVGPKLALAILSGMPPDQLLDAVSQNDVGRLSAIPGVGKKTAERLALELKDKLARFKIESFTESKPAGLNGLYDDALSALVNLGYKKPEAEKALKRIASDSENPTLETLIKDSLNLLS